MRFKGITPAYLVLGLSALLGACGGDEPAEDVAVVAQPGAAGTAACADVVNIGYSGPLSGGAALYGKNVQNGLQMAIDEINQAGGLNVNGQRSRLNLVSLDDKYLPSETATNVRRLVQQNQTPVIAIPHAGGILAVQQMNTMDPKFILQSYTSDPRILEANNPLQLMIPPRYDNYFGPFVNMTMEQFGNRLAMLNTTTSYGKAWAEGISKTWREKGGQVIGDFAVDYNTTTDFTSAVTKALASNPDVMLIGGPSQPTALVVKAARQQGYKGGFIVMDQAKFEEMDDVVPVSQLEGAVGVYPLIQYPGPGREGFVQRYEQKFGTEQVPTSEVGLNYGAVRVWAKAMELAGTCTDVDAIRAQIPAAVKQVPATETPYVTNEVTEQGHLYGPLIIARVQNGKYEPVEVTDQVL